MGTAQQSGRHTHGCSPSRAAGTHKGTAPGEQQAHTWVQPQQSGRHTNMGTVPAERQAHTHGYSPSRAQQRHTYGRQRGRRSRPPSPCRGRMQPSALSMAMDTPPHPSKGTAAPFCTSRRTSTLAWLPDIVASASPISCTGSLGLVAICSMPCVSGVRGSRGQAAGQGLGMRVNATKLGGHMLHMPSVSGVLFKGLGESAQRVEGQGSGF